MSLWRAKKRFEANQDLNELADSTLLAITLLRHNHTANDVYSENEVEDNLNTGVEIIQKLLEALENPGAVSEYYVAIAEHLRKTGTKQTKNTFEEELREAKAVLEQTSEDLEWDQELNTIENLFRRIEDFTARNSAQSLDNVTKNLAVGNRRT